MGLFKTGAVEKTDKQPDKQYLVKRCPECLISLPLDTSVCYSCRTRVGEVDGDGKARKKTNWYSYLACFVSWAVFGLYVWWAFF